MEGFTVSNLVTDFEANVIDKYILLFHLRFIVPISSALYHTARIRFDITLFSS